MNNPDLFGGMETKRRKSLFFFVLYIVLGSITGLGSFAFIILGTILELYPALFIACGFILFLGVTPAIAFLAIHAETAYKKDFFTTFAPMAAEGRYDDFVYPYKKEVSSLAKECTEALQKRTDPENASYFEGKLGSVSFYSFAYSYTKPGKGHPVAVYSRYIEYTFPKAFPCALSLVDKQTKPLLKLPSLPITLHSESLYLDDHHEIHCDDELAGTSLLSPLLADGLENLNRQYHTHFVIRFSGNKVLAFCDDSSNHFEIKLTRPLSKEYLLEFSNEVLLPSRLLTALGLSHWMQA
jgi:hypothetical protein